MRKKLIPIALGLTLLLGVGWWILGRTEEPRPQLAPEAAQPTAKRARIAAPQQLKEEDLALLAGTGSARLDGMVTDATGEPVPGAEVAVAGNPARLTTTEQDGSFFFEGLAPTDVVVTARHGGRATVGLASIATDGAFILLTLRDGAELVVNVSNAQGPIVGAKVITSLPLISAAPTDAGGETRLRGLPEGYLGLSISADAHATAHTGEIVKSGTQRVSVVLRPSVAARGLVVDEQGQPVAAANIYVGGSDAEVMVEKWRRADTTTDADGAFSLPLATQSDLRLIAQKEGYAPSQSSIISTSASAPPAIRLVLSAGRRITGTVVNVQAAPMANVKVAAWMGMHRQHTFTDAQGAFVLAGLPPASVGVRAGGERGEGPLEGIGLIAFPRAAIAGFLGSMGRPDDMRVAELGSSVLSATADADGRFVFTGAAPGEYEIGLVEEVSAFDRVTAKAGDQNVSIKLASSARVVAKISLPDGTPVDGVFNIGMALGREFSGGVVDLPKVPTGTFAIRIFGETFKEKSIKDVVLKEGTNDLGAFTVQPGRLVSGKVVDGRGKAVAGAGVGFGTTAAAVASTTRTGGDGTFGIITSNDYETSLFAALGQSVSPPIAVPAGEGDVTGLMLTLGSSGHVRGTLTKAGKPYGNVELMFLLEGDTSGTPVATATTGSDGEFAVRNLPIGKHVALIVPDMTVDSMAASVRAWEVGTVKVAPNAWTKVAFEAKDIDKSP